VNVVSLYDENILASGDDMGGMRVWDVRAVQSRKSSAGKIASAQIKRKADKTDHSDYISAFCSCPKKSALLATSADGKLSVWDIRQKYVGLNALSDDVEEELLSVQLIRVSMS
jgi:WD40 repeat protein